MKAPALRPSFVKTVAAASVVVSTAGVVYADPQPMPTANPPPPGSTPMPQLMTNPPPPQPVTAANTGPRLRPGRHRCSFVEDGSRYARQCVITAQRDQSLRVVAAGTRLNPTNGFTLTLTGSAPSYHVEGTLTAFARCTGNVTATAVYTTRGSTYVARWGTCEIAIAP